MLLMDTVHIASRKSWLTLALDRTSILVQTSLAHSSFLELSNECHPCVTTLVSALPHPSYLSVETGDALNCQKCLHPPFFLCSAPMPWPMLPLIHLVDMWLTFFFSIFVGNFFLSHIFPGCPFLSQAEVFELLRGTPS